MTRRRAAACVALVCALLPLQPAAGAELRSELTGQASVVDAQAEATQLRRALAALREQAAQSVAAYEQAEDDLAAAVTRSVALTRELEAARDRARDSGRQADARVAALYRSGGAAGLLSTLAGASDPRDLAGRVANLTAVVRSDERTRRDAGDDREALAQLQQETARNAADQVHAVQAQQESARQLAEALQEQTRAVAVADARVQVALAQQQAAARAAAAARLAAARAAALRAQQELAARQAAQLAAQQVAAQQRAATGTVAPPLPVGSLPGWTAGPYGGGPSYAGPPGACPVGPSHSFTDTWHAPRSGGRQHQGTDVFAPEGSPAYAVVDGVVDKVGDGGLGGITLWLRGDGGDRYYYAHNAANVAAVGQRVRAGDVVAYVGRTGNAETTPAHVHFQAHPGGGEAVNPYAWLAALCVQ